MLIILIKYENGLDSKGFIAFMFKFLLNYSIIYVHIKFKERILFLKLYYI
jgi:hypothetical protein